MDPFGPASAHEIEVDVYTAAYRVSGKLLTRFGRVADILNQVTSTHLPVSHAILSEHADPGATLGVPQILVALDEVLVMVAAGASGEARSDMRIPKRPVRAQLGIPPFRVTGTVHVPQGSRPVDGLLNASDRYLPMTDATIVSGQHPELGRSVPALAFRRDRAHVILVADDENPDQLLADVLDERTAEAWLRSDREEDRTGRSRRQPQP